MEHIYFEAQLCINIWNFKANLNIDILINLCLGTSLDQYKSCQHAVKMLRVHRLGVIPSFCERRNVVLHCDGCIISYWPSAC